MCYQCEIDNALIELHAKDFITASLDGEPLSTGQLETMFTHSLDDFDSVLFSLTNRGRDAMDQGLI